MPWALSGVRVAEHQKHWHLTVDRMTGWLATRHVCVSQGVSRFCQEVGGISPERMVVIPNGVDTDLFDRATALPRADLGIPEGCHVALSIGRLNVQKGLPFLLDAAERVAGQRNDWRLLIVGDGPEREWLVTRIASTPLLAGCVQWLGRRDDVPRLLKTADLVVLASLWEGMPNVVLEAMAARRAVVATVVEGSEDLVVPEQTGWLVPPRDASALANALLEAAHDPDRLRALGDRGRERVEANYTLRAMIAAYDRLWSGILGFETE